MITYAFYLILVHKYIYFYAHSEKRCEKHDLIILSRFYSFFPFEFLEFTMTGVVVWLKLEKKILHAFLKKYTDIEVEHYVNIPKNIKIYIFRLYCLALISKMFFLALIFGSNLLS